MKKNIPARSFFGDDNHEPIELQKKVLLGQIKESHFDEYSDYDRLEETLVWMNGKNEQWLVDLKEDIRTHK